MDVDELGVGDSAWVLRLRRDLSRCCSERAQGLRRREVRSRPHDDERIPGKCRRDIAGLDQRPGGLEGPEIGLGRRRVAAEDPGAVAQAADVRHDRRRRGGGDQDGGAPLD